MEKDAFLAFTGARVAEGETRQKLNSRCVWEGTCGKCGLSNAFRVSTVPPSAEGKNIVKLKNGEKRRKVELKERRLRMEILKQFHDALAFSGDRFVHSAALCNVEKFSNQLMFASVIRLVHHEEIGDLQNARLVHLHGVTHTWHDDDGRSVDVLSDGDVILARADGLDQQGVPTGSTHQFDDVWKGRVVFAHNGKAAVEHVVVHRVEVDSKAIAEQRAAGDRTHRIERNHRHPLTAADRFVCHRGDQRAFASAGCSSQADHSLGSRSWGF